MAKDNGYSESENKKSHEGCFKLRWLTRYHCRDVHTQGHQHSAFVLNFTLITRDARGSRMVMIFNIPDQEYVSETRPESYSTYFT